MAITVNTVVNVSEVCNTDNSVSLQSQIIVTLIGKFITIAITVSVIDSAHAFQFFILYT